MLSSASLIRAAHADLVGRCNGDAPGENGAYTAKTICGKRYWYVQTPSAEGRRQKYIGPETPELAERIARDRQARADAKERRVLVSLLIRTFRVPRPPPQTGRVIAALAGAFRDGAILLGAPACQTYATMLGTAVPGPAPRAGDPVQIASRTPPSLLGALQGISTAFRVLSRTEDSVRLTSYVAADGLRVDVLSPRPDEPGVLAYLLEKPERAVVLHDCGIPVAVAAPARYALATLLPPSRTDGDIRQAQALVAALQPEAVAEAWQEAERRGWPLDEIRGLLAQRA
jgi:hypothetical protein